MNSLGINQAPTCSMIGMDISVNQNFYWADNNDNNFVIDFPDPVRIDGLYYNDGAGIAPFKIEYQKCNCDEWFDLTTIITKDLKVDGSNYYGAWNVEDVRRRNFKKLRFTKVTPDANIINLVFCGETRECPSKYAEKIAAYDPPKDLITTGTSKTVANLAWTPAVENQYVGDPKNEITEPLDIVMDYDVFYAPTKDFNHSDITKNPKVETHFAGVELANLSPGTEYTAKIAILRPYPCPIYHVSAAGLVSNPIIFTTASDQGQNRNDELDDAEKEQQFTIAPNPAQDFVKISFPDGNIQQIEIFNGNGQLVYLQEVPANDQEIKIDNLSAHISPGIYIIKGLTTKNAILTEKLVILK